MLGRRPSAAYPPRRDPVLKIASWNVNSIKARLTNVLAWVRSAAPDVLLLQEIKTVDENFPALEFEDLGYTAAVHGQKTYNGVAIISKAGLSDVRNGLPGDGGDTQARYIEALVGERLRVASIYLPNGNPVDSEKFSYKLAWMERLRGRVRTLLDNEEPFVLGGDYNVIPEPFDAHEFKKWANDALGRLESRTRLRAILNLGVTEAFRALHPSRQAFTFWDYQGGAWSRDDGIRIDHLLLSPQAADRLAACDIDKKPRGQEKASDHTPIWCQLDIEMP